MHVVQISDTHLSHLGGVTTDNFVRLVDHLNAVVRPDLVVNTGDVVMLSPDLDEDRSVARALHDRLAAPVRVLPGNHDVGEVGEEAWMGIVVTDQRVEAFEAAFGPSRFVELVGDLALVGINSEILSSGLACEGEQWQWLDETAARLAHHPVLLFSHKPLWSPFGDVPGHTVAIAKDDRERILELFSASPVTVSASGHLHRYLNGTTDGVLTVSAPSTAFLAAAGGDPRPGLQQLGYVELLVDGSAVRASYRSVPGLVELGAFDLPEVVATKARLEQAAP
ncbi:MAG: metallophosphoesterase [Actinomycetota bacterium]|jgi:3',5'-cyclic AMP phosphodiesterase CpdA|nr:metallophosphoesterase [Actinomycetota bacterium]